MRIDDGTVKIDSVTLTQCIENCFAMSRDGRLTLEQRRDFLVQGKILRGHLINLISATFNGNAQKVLEANQAIRDVNSKLLEASKDLDSISQAMQLLASLAGLLANLLGLAAFV